ncbi:MAG: DegT/DnrJ/EryC1/StrS family aminotransferase [Planctomycetes bacterium]|nr:DegT/DnrJ/EryC1/StrS family aminotransferase [Planctomycetota bacterium]
MTRKTLVKLAIEGGPKAVTSVSPRAPKHDPAELEAVERVLARGQIPFVRGPEVLQLRKEFSRLYGMKYCVTTSSGTSAIHTALGSLGIGRGDEVITSPITDMGTLIPILAQNAVPIFADVDPESLNITPETVEARITRHTRCILVVHLYGNPVDMPGLMRLARRRQILVVEDLAQGYLCEIDGRLCGTFGDWGCFSLNDSKHIGAGDGGMLITNDARLADRADLFADKCYDRTGAGRKPFFAPYNYRINLLAAAIAVEQLKKLRGLTRRRNRIGDRLTAGLTSLAGVRPPRIHPKARCTYWYYVFHVDENRLGASIEEFQAAMQAEGVAVARHGTSVLEWPLFRERKSNRHACAWECPFYKGKVDYRLEQYPGVLQAKASAMRMGISEHMSAEEVRQVLKAFQKVTGHFLGRRGASASPPRSG